MNRAHLKTKRELIRKTYRELEQPATVVELCDRYLKLDPVDGIVWAWFGHSLMELGKFDEARAALQTARGLVQADDQLAFVIRCGGDLERSQGKYDAAETLYKEAIDLAPAHDAMWLAFGRLVFDLGRLEEAEDTFRKAASLKGSFSGTALYELGRVLRARGEFFEARRFLKAATKLIPHDERPRSVLADIESVLRVRSQSPDR